MHADRRSLPKVDEILDDMRGSSVFTTIDFFQGYWRIKMDETCKEKAAFISREETFLFEVMLFGLMDSRAKFQRMMDILLMYDAMSTALSYSRKIPKKMRFIWRMYSPS